MRRFGGHAALAVALLGLSALAAAGQARLTIDTQALTLTVVASDDRVLARFHNISIGHGGAADLHLRGDATTPRGDFRVAWIDRASRYGTFYGLDYPNEASARRAEAAGIIDATGLDAILRAHRLDRIPPQNTPLGGRLGIHGLGQGDPRVHAAFNWTNGCVALTNAQMRQLARWVRVGTPVMIR